MSETTQNQETEIKNVKPGFTEDQKKEMATFLNIDSFDESTLFINVKYEGKSQGRTCVILGALGFHARLLGNQSGMEYDERLGIKMEKEHQFDFSISVKRPEFYGVSIIKRKIDWSKNDEHPIYEKKPRPEFQNDLLIYYAKGDHLTIFGLSEEDAILFKKMIWYWGNYHFPSVNQANL